MSIRAIFGLSMLLSLVSSCVFAKLYLWPYLRSMDRENALAVLVAPHMFLRFIGLSFLVPGVVSGSLPQEFAVSAGYGDLVAGLLAILATVAIARRAPWAIAATWAFNMWGAADLIMAGVQGVLLNLDAGALGAAFFLPTAIAPPLLVTHALIFWFLIMPLGTARD